MNRLIAHPTEHGRSFSQKINKQSARLLYATSLRLRKVMGLGIKLYIELSG
jgi:hypothetical protein